MEEVCEQEGDGREGGGMKEGERSASVRVWERRGGGGG